MPTTFTFEKYEVPSIKPLSDRKSLLTDIIRNSPIQQITETNDDQKDDQEAKEEAQMILKQLSTIIPDEKVEQLKNILEYLCKSKTALDFFADYLRHDETAEPLDAVELSLHHLKNEVFLRTTEIKKDGIILDLKEKKIEISKAYKTFMKLRYPEQHLRHLSEEAIETTQYQESRPFSI